jgi:hypothetical protein
MVRHCKPVRCPEGIRGTRISAKLPIAQNAMSRYSCRASKPQSIQDDRSIILDDENIVIF